MYDQTSAPIYNPDAGISYVPRHSCVARKVTYIYVTFVSTQVKSEQRVMRITYMSNLRLAVQQANNSQNILAVCSFYKSRTYNMSFSRISISPIVSLAELERIVHCT